MIWPMRRPGFFCRAAIVDGDEGGGPDRNSEVVGGVPAVGEGGDGLDHIWGDGEGTKFLGGALFAARRI